MLPTIIDDSPKQECQTIALRTPLRVCYAQSVPPLVHMLWFTANPTHFPYCFLDVTSYVLWHTTWPLRRNVDVIRPSA